MSRRQRRMVPMPTKAPRPTSQRTVPRALPIWGYLAFLIVTAILLYYAKWPILIIAGIVGLVKGWSWLERRFPRTMRFML